MKFAIATLLASLAAPAVNAQEVIGLHGSGTTNPSKCYWHIMDLIQTQTKLPTRMTYRAVGSSVGQTEFIGDTTANMTSIPDNDFGSGDIPLSADDYGLFPAESILHLPIVLGAISFFHSVPTGDKGLNLNPCVLAKIFNRDITDWMDEAIVFLNPGLSLPSPYPITVARRVEGSSSTASITQYLHDACPGNWPETLVGKEINWNENTRKCEGSGGMTECITTIPGTIGYIDSGHGHSEGLQEIELLNADKYYISSKEAAMRGGIMSATDSANLPEFLDGSFADVNLLNQAGVVTWPIVAMSYIYIRKDLTYMPNPASQTLLKAFLKALYTEEYIGVCEKEFGFFPVTGALRDKALAAIDDLVITAGAPEWTYELSTDERIGQGDYVISVKRESYSEIEQDAAVDALAQLMIDVDDLKAENVLLQEALHLLDHSHSETNGIESLTDAEMDKDTQLKAALALGSISFILWMLALIFVLTKFVLHI